MRSSNELPVQISKKLFFKELEEENLFFGIFWPKVILNELKKNSE